MFDNLNDLVNNTFCPLCKNKFTLLNEAHGLYLDCDCCEILTTLVWFHGGKEYEYCFINKINTDKLEIDIESNSCLITTGNWFVVDIKNKLDKIFFNSDYFINQDKINKLFNLVKEIEDNLIFI